MKEESERRRERKKTLFLGFEKEKVKGAIRTDFILSAEIVVISLGTVATAAFRKPDKQ